MIKIIIERRIMPGLEDEYEQAAREAMRVSLITKWRDLRAWKEWHASEERAMAMQRILPLLTEDETIRIYEPGY